MGKTRDPLKKISNTQGTLHTKMGSIKDRNGMYLRDAEDTIKRQQEYSRTVQKKIFKTQIFTME